MLAQMDTRIHTKLSEFEYQVFDNTKLIKSLYTNISFV